MANDIRVRTNTTKYFSFFDVFKKVKSIYKNTRNPNTHTK